MQAGKRDWSEAKRKGWVKMVVLAIAWLLIFSLARDLWRIRKGFERISESKARLDQEGQKNLSLKEKMSLVITDEYKERLMREQLNMQKVGEVVAVLPKTDKVYGADERGEERSGLDNWEKWWSLLK